MHTFQWLALVGAIVVCSIVANGRCDAADEPAAQADSQAPAAQSPGADALQLKRQQADAAKSLGIPLEVTNSVGMRLTLIPVGEFEMGTPESLVDRNPDELPHRVKITRPFYVGVCEVTQGEYQKVTGKNPSYFAPTGGGAEHVQGVETARLPVENVSWEDAVKFCAALSSLGEETNANRTYQLPTEAQWEYACRAGTQTRFCCGDDKQALGDFAWFVENSSGTTHPVGMKRPNAWGVYDVHGNVREWCQDWYAEDYYRNSPADDPAGPRGGLYRVFRGGCHGLSPYYCRSGNRFGPYPLPLNLTGFRVVCLLPRQ